MRDGKLTSVPEPILLTDLTEPHIPDMADLAPPPRFQEARFANYHPQDDTQARAVEILAERQATWTTQPRRNWRSMFRRNTETVRPGLYLDGGFGVGKTHLLAALWHEANGVPRSYTSFQELLYFIGTLGMDGATTAFKNTKLLLIDEFELDDPGNTLLVKRFLEAYFAHGGRVVTTSNTAPTALGAGRFNAEDFQREIQSVAAQFDLVAIDGPDYRQRSASGTWLTETERALLETMDTQQGTVVHTSFPQLLHDLTMWHPARYAGLAKQLHALHITDVHVVPTQNDALRLVHFIDKIYDYGVHVRATGVIDFPDLFHDSYAASAFEKKHLRCQSRLAELLHHAATAAHRPIRVSA